MNKTLDESYRQKLRDAYLKIAELEAELARAQAYDPNELLTIEWLCEQTGLTPRQVALRINSGELVAHDLSARERVVRRQDYEAWLASLRTDRAQSQLSDPTDDGEGEPNGIHVENENRRGLHLPAPGREVPSRSLGGQSQDWQAHQATGDQTANPHDGAGHQEEGSNHSGTRRRAGRATAEAHARSLC